MPANVHTLSPVRARSFSVATAAAGTAGVAIVPGAYRLIATQHCTVAITTTDAATTALDATSQPGAPTGKLRLHAGVPEDIEVPPGTWYLSAIRLTDDGSLTVNGPFAYSGV
jgi:hypothetical protein